MPLNRGSVRIDQVDRVEETIFIDFLNFDNGLLNTEQADGIAIPKFKSTADIPSDLPEGTLVFVTGENRMFFFDGTSAVKLNSAQQYTDEEARTAVDGSSVSLNHDNLTGVSTADHHSRYSDSEAFQSVEENEILLRLDNRNSDPNVSTGTLWYRSDLD